MNIIEVDVGKTKLFSIGQQYNSNALVIHFVNLPNQKNKYIYYKIDDIEKEVPLVSDLFIVSRPLMMHSGEVKAQIITRDENNSIIELTKNFTMRIQPSNYSGIGEDENYPDDPNIKNYYVKIDGKIQSMDELIALVQSKLDKGEFIGAQGPKGEKGEPGEKGDPGDVTEEYRNLASQIAQNATNAQASATNAQTSASNAQKALDDTKEFVNQAKSEMNQIKTDTNTLKEEATTSAVNAKASETKAKEYADNLQASTDDISKLKKDLVANSKEDAKTKRSLSALWALNNGISYRFETDSEKAYKKQIPSGAKLASVDKVGGQIIKQDDALIVAGVNDVDVVGKNIFECEHFSCSGINESNNLDLSNDYGTSINSTAPSNRVTVTQSKVGQADNITSYLNGYFCVAFKPFSLNKDYVFSLDVIPSNKLISNPKVIILMNGNNSINVEYAQDLQIGKRCKLYFNLKANGKELIYIEIRNSGISGIFENFQIEEGSINTSYSPYTKKSYPIPQSIQNLDGYGWSAGTAYNYVDFENKKYYKCVDKRAYQSNDDTDSNVITDGTNTYYELAEPIVTDISDIIGDTFQEPFEVETGGSLTFKNTNGDGYRIAVPSDIQYVVALSEVNT